MRWRPDAEDVLAALGALSLGLGCWLIWPPLALIVIGLLALAASVRLARHTHR